MFPHHCADLSSLMEHHAMFQFQWTAWSQNGGVPPASGPALFPHAAIGISDSRVPSYFTLLIFHAVRLSATALSGQYSVNITSHSEVQHSTPVICIAIVLSSPRQGPTLCCLWYSTNIPWAFPSLQNKHPFPVCHLVSDREDVKFTYVKMAPTVSLRNSD